MRWPVIQTWKKSGGEGKVPNNQEGPSEAE